MTIIPNISQINSNIKRLQEEEKLYRERMLRSPTAVAGLSSPTNQDLQNQTELERVQKAIRRMKNEKIDAQWYPPKDEKASAAEASGKPEGFMGKTIDVLSKPLYTIVGGAEHFLGQGEDTLAESMAQNLKDRNTFGDVLRTSGVDSFWASAPLGFVLDVVLDPINWVTMGTGALLPRLGMGIAKGFTKKALAKGVTSAAKSGVLQKTTSLARWTPGFKATTAFNKLAKKSLKATKEWEDFSGITADVLMRQRGLIGLRNTGYRRGLKELFDSVAEMIPGGEKFLEHFNYDPVGWVRRTKIEEALLDAFGPKVDISAALKAYKENKSMSPFLREGGRSAVEMQKVFDLTPPVAKLDDLLFRNTSGEDVIKAVKNEEVDRYMSGLLASKKSEMERVSIEMVNSVDDAETVLKGGKKYSSSNLFKRTQALADERLSAIGIEGKVTLEEISEIAKSGALGDTGVKWFDRMMNGKLNKATGKMEGGIRNFRKEIKIKEKGITINGEKILDKYHQALGIFRISKVAASASAWMNAVVGNMIMLQMATGRVTPTFLINLKFAKDLYRNKPGTLAKLAKKFEGVQDGQVTDFLSKNPMLFNKTMGLEPASILGAQNRTDWIKLKAKEGGFYSESTKDIFEKQANKGFKELKELAKLEGATEAGIRGVEGGTSRMRKAMAEGKDIDWRNASTGPGIDLFEHDATRKMLDAIAKNAKANPRNYFWQTMNFTFNKLPSGYESVDQAYKLASFLTSVKHGYTSNELRGIRHLIDLSGGENIIPVSQKAAEKFGEMRYLLPPERAIELSNVLFLNYAAMPSAVRVIRNFPLIGSPFISFMYGMALKTGQTLAYNPSAFTKANFALKEFSGIKTPFEKKALQGEYYSHLNEQTMFRLPGKFFDEHPLYANLTNMIPYYSLNMFTASETRFNTNSLPAKLVSSFQKSPIMKDPIGATLFDYFIQPMILGDSIAPQGQFGQPLYPTNASVLSKLAYAGRSGLEAFVPGGLAYTGLAGAFLPDKVIQASPLYQWRGLANAMKAQTPLGKTSKEGAASRSFRKWLAITGIPIQSPVDTSYAKRFNR